MKRLLAIYLFLAVPVFAFSQNEGYTRSTISSKCWSVNPVIATSTQQNALAAYENFVYVVFYNADRKLCVSRNSNYGKGDQWVTIELAHSYEKRNGVFDNHNTPNIAISPKDNRIHLAFDMHARDLRYMISDENMATVSDEKFTAGGFNEVRNYLQSNRAAIHKVTYPRFVNGDNGELFFMYRERGSGNGDTWFARYNDDGFWPKGSIIIDGAKGSYMGDENRCAYFNDVQYQKSTLFLTWVWRESPNAYSNHDLMFAYSMDNGQSWMNSNGQSVPLPINLESEGVKVADIPMESGLSNHNGCAVDGQGNVHVVVRSGDNYVHYTGIHETGKYTWSSNTIGTFRGDRPKLYCDITTNTLYFMVNTPTHLRMFTASEGHKWKDWKERASIQGNFITSGNSIMCPRRKELMTMVVSKNNLLEIIMWPLD
ncbi:BNR-4 repeat-containing protein [Echinicola sp. 20G]|uniref:BNR-4 repeat-containing protein n=1 Tax=Echinicola sp. 20G TaxID=2781961 RepID=UPI0019103369|nr:BNR-4 repeat-containing protein [Echinicola sp. 20G]